MGVKVENTHHTLLKVAVKILPKTPFSFLKLKFRQPIGIFGQKLSFDT
jgi:hypothetical protein